MPVCLSSELEEKGEWGQGETRKQSGKKGEEREGERRRKEARATGRTQPIWMHNTSLEFLTGCRILGWPWKSITSTLDVCTQRCLDLKKYFLWELFSLPKVAPHSLTQCPWPWGALLAPFCLCYACFTSSMSCVWPVLRSLQAFFANFPNFLKMVYPCGYYAWNPKPETWISARRLGCKNKESLFASYNSTSDRSRAGETPSGKKSLSFACDRFGNRGRDEAA